MGPMDPGMIWVNGPRDNYGVTVVDNSYSWGS